MNVAEKEYMSDNLSDYIQRQLNEIAWIERELFIAITPIESSPETIDEYISSKKRSLKYNKYTLTEVDAMVNKYSSFLLLY